MKPKFYRMLRLLVGSLFLPCAMEILAQAGGGTLTITVQDASGSVVPAAKLVLTDVHTNDARNANTLNTGSYSFVGLNAGTYSLIVSKTGYSNAVYDSIIIHATRVTDVAVKLAVGTVTNKVEVRADQSPLVESTSNVLGNTIDLKEIEYLPMDDRDPTTFAYLLPGTVNGIFNNQQGQAQVAALDGIIATSSRGKGGTGVGSSNIGSVTTPRIQNIEEMTVQTSNLDADEGYGQASMQAVFTTRRGTNEYHGRLFANIQNSSLNANSWYNDYWGVPKSLYHKEDFGGTVGGPVWKNKLFFFGSYEQDSIPGKGTWYSSFMTSALQKGDYTFEGTDGNSHTVNLYSLAAAAGNIQSTADTGVAAELAKINNTLSLGTIGNVSGADTYESKNIQQLNFREPNNTTYFYPTFRIDYNVKQNLRAHFAFNETKVSSPTGEPPSFPGSDFSWQQDGSKSTGYSAAIGVDWTIKPTLVNSFQGGYLYNASDSSYKSRAGNYNQKHNIVWWNAPWNMNGSADGYYQGASGDYFYSGIATFYPLVSFSDNLAWQHKSHFFTFGGSFYREQDHYWNPPLGYENITMGIGSGDPASNVFSTTNPDLSLANSTQLSEMQSYYAVLTGDLSVVSSSHPLNPKTKLYSKFGALNLDELQKGWGLYAQDSWHVRPNLTVNLGLRWDFTGDDHDLNGVYYSPNNAGLWGPSGENNQFKPGTLAGDPDPSYYARSHAYKPWNVTPQPTIGFSWTPKVSDGFLGKLLGKDSTVIRAGYSLRRYTPQYQDYWSYASDYGSFFYQSDYAQAATTVGTGYYVGGNYHYADYLAGKNTPTHIVTPTSYSSTITESSQADQASLAGMQSNIAQPYIQSWNFGFQRKVGQDNALEVRYVGNRGVHQWIALNPNEVNIFENNFLQEFKNAQQNLTSNGGTSFQGPISTPILDQAFSNDPTGNYTNGTFIWELEHGQVGSMAANLSTPWGLDGNYYCNLVSSSFSPCSTASTGLWGYSGSGGNEPINFFQANPYEAGSSVGYLTGAGYSNYNSLQIEFRQQSWHGMQFNVNYTWSRSFGMSSQYTLRNLRLSYGPTSADVHHHIHGYGTYDLPFGKGKAFLSGSGLLDRAVGGWTLGAIIGFQTGGPFQLTGGNNTFNNLFDGGVVLNGVTNKQLQHSIRMRSVPGAPSYEKYWIDPKYIATSGQSNSKYLSPNSTPGTQGTRYWLWGFKYWNPDLSISKSVTIKNRMKFNMQGEFLGAFNHTSWGVGDTGLQDSDFGKTFYPSSGRTIEIRANFEF